MTKPQVDGAWRNDLKLAGLGWTLLERNIHSSYATHCHYVDSPLLAEALAMREALSKSKELGFQKLQCEFDSSQLIKAIFSHKPPPEIYGVIADILCLSLQFIAVSFRGSFGTKTKLLIV